MMKFSLIGRKMIDSRAFKPEIHPYVSKLDQPYSYSPLVLFSTGKSDMDTIVQGTVYSDRLWEWDYKLTDKLCIKHFGNRGQYFDERSPESIEQFLRERLKNSTLKLERIIEWCNPSNGYPNWSFEYTY